MLSHLLDTSVYSQRLKRKPLPGVIDRWKALGDAKVAVSSMTETEIRYGLEKRGSERLWLEFREFLENRLIVLPVDKPVAELFAGVKHEQEQLGEPRADFDLLIAATALTHGLILATLNIRHFEGLRGLEVENGGEV